MKACNSDNNQPRQNISILRGLGLDAIAKLTNQPRQNLSDLYSLGLVIIAEHNKYNKDEYDYIKIWTVGLGSLSGNRDVRDYDPKKHTHTELRILALQDRFKDIGGVGIGVNEYLDLLKKYYPRDLDDVLRLTIVTKYIDPRYVGDELSPITVSETHHPPLVSLYIQAGISIPDTVGSYTNEIVDETRLTIINMVEAFIWMFQYYVPE